LDWYKITPAEVVREGGAILFNYYRSLAQVLRAIYPSYQWNAQQFVPSATADYWADKHNQRAALDKIGTLLGIKKVVKKSQSHCVHILI